MTYKLSDRPDWWLPILMKWVTIICVVLALVLFVGSLLLGWVDTYALTEPVEGEDSVVLNLSYFASEAAWSALGILFYGTVFWMISLAVDKIDQLVWLNASDDDREEILAKRKKKNA